MLLYGELSIATGVKYEKHDTRSDTVQWQNPQTVFDDENLEEETSLSLNNHLLDEHNLPVFHTFDLLGRNASARPSPDLSSTTVCIVFQAEPNHDNKNVRNRQQRPLEKEHKADAREHLFNILKKGVRV